jgi:hypothetical protein
MGESNAPLAGVWANQTHRWLVYGRIKRTAGTPIKAFTCPNNLKDYSENQVFLNGIRLLPIMTLRQLR